MSSPWDAEENREVVQTEYRVYDCPSLERSNPGAEIHLTAYVGVAGLGSGAASLPLEDRRCGFFGYDRKIRFRDVTDGLSNTLMVIETGTDNRPWAQGGFATVRGLDPDDLPCIGPGRPFGNGHRQNRDFFRPGGWWVAQAAVGDGSVRVLAASTDARVLRAIVTIAGGEEVGPDW